MSLRGLIACEESGVVVEAFRKQGVECYSCDIKPTSSPTNLWHIQDDVRNVLSKEHFDFLIAHPPCTRLNIRGNYWTKKKGLEKEQKDAIDFFMYFVNLRNVNHRAIENPVGIMSTIYRSPNQYIQPYWFGDPEQKKTALWLFNLPPLNPDPSTYLSTPPNIYFLQNGRKVTFNDRYGSRHAAIRSKTFPGIADAMAAQWTKYMLKSNMK